ncbi:hypothetical protein HanRHA438_Chr14g0668831 [Helianthus annuus]|nr:hypothetical protein HanRHA438_Chr14g0668831 [Helianthus annuus]
MRLKSKGHTLSRNSLKRIKLVQFLRDISLNNQKSFSDKGETQQKTIYSNIKKDHRAHLKKAMTMINVRIMPAYLIH